MIRLIKESSESTNGSLANSKYAKYLTADQIKEFDNQYKMLASLAKLINDNIEILKEQDTKVPDVFWGAGDGEEDYIYAWLEDAWDQFKDYVDSIGCEIDVRDGRSSPHVTFNCDFLYNLRDELRGEYKVTVDDVAHAIFETRYGGYDDICTSVKDFDFEVDYNLEKYDYDDTRDAVQSTFNDFTFYNTTDYASTYEDIDRAIQALDYIDSFKNTAAESYRSWYEANGYGDLEDEFDESVRRRSIKEYIDNSEDIYDLEGCFDELKRMERSKKNMTKEQYNLFTAAYNAISNWRYSNGSEKDVFHSCYKFAEYCKNNPGRLTIQQMQLVDYIHERT